MYPIKNLFVKLFRSKENIKTSEEEVIKNQNMLDKEGHIYRKVLENYQIIFDTRDTLNILKVKQETKDSLIGQDFNNSIQSIINLVEMNNLKTQELNSEIKKLETKNLELSLKNKIITEKKSEVK